MSCTTLNTADSVVIQRDKCLKSLNSLSLPARAEYFCEVASVSQIKDALAFARSKKLCVTPLGAGSNAKNELKSLYNVGKRFKTFNRYENTFGRSI